MTLRAIWAYLGFKRERELIPYPPYTGPKGVQRLPVKTQSVGWRKLRPWTVDDPNGEREIHVAHHDTLHLGFYFQVTTDRVNDFEDGLHLYLMDCLKEGARV